MKKDSDNNKQAALQSPSRRRFLNDSCALSIGGLAMGTVGGGVLLPSKTVHANHLDLTQFRILKAETGEDRQEQVYELRKRVARYYKNLPLVDHPNNGDDSAYDTRIGSFTKSLPHNALGEVDQGVYDTYLTAIETGDRDLFDTIPTPGNITLRNIENIWSMDYLGPDSHNTSMPPAPAIASAEHASEFAELYWQALTRDIPFSEYDNNKDIEAAAKDLSNMTDFRGPKQGGIVTPSTLFRGFTQGDVIGPFISQFLLKDIPYGAMLVQQRMITSPEGQDYVTTYDDWLNQQNGTVGKVKINDPVHRYLHNGRNMGEYVGRDFLYQPYLNAALILTRGLKMPLDPNNPYNKPNKPSQHGHNTFGGHHIYHLVVRIANIAQKHAWYQKWAVHRRLRPEEYGGRVHNHVNGVADYPMHDDLLGSEAISRVKARWGSYLLPQQYPEGVPPHPAYPAGHATIAGACATMLKAFMDENAVIPNPVVANADGTELVPYVGEPLTVGNEINKLASNISIGRDTAGVHWRSDSVEGMKLGEGIAINVLRDLRHGYYEKFEGFHLTKFDGTQIIV
ncbi:MAG: vanadium-dependent haloperoxidase [Gammaproteobacteria bacterium]|nr:vanadium-dependent haloperoxidase [Gammaproteobacteria bacterium]